MGSRIMNVVLRKTRAEEILNSKYAGLIEEYAKESSVKGMPSIFPQLSMYRQLEQNGTFYCIGAYLEDTLIGFVSILTTIVPHYGARVSTIESIFVGKKYRKTGAGTLLRLAAERYAKSQGSLGVLTCAPLHSKYSKLLPKSGYAHTNEVFFKSFIHE